MQKMGIACKAGVSVGRGHGVMATVILMGQQNHGNNCKGNRNLGDTRTAKVLFHKDKKHSAVA